MQDEYNYFTGLGLMNTDAYTISVRSVDAKCYRRANTGGLVQEVLELFQHFWLPAEPGWGNTDILPKCILALSLPLVEVKMPEI
ncbi:unnamed protein product [Caretta caretta]